MANIDAELEQQLKEAGKRLSCPLDSIDELLFVLDQIEKPLSRVDQSPKKSMLDALKPLMNALVQESLLKHSDIDVKVAVASCVSQITRITAPDQPYDNDQMRDIFQLIISSFEGIADQSSRSYIKRASILETVFNVNLCSIMLDLECDALFVEMFEHFLRSVRDYHHESIYPSMESIMALVLEESEEIPVEMLKLLLTSLKKDSEGVLPVARKLAEGVLLKAADKLKPYLMPAIVSLGDALDKYTKVVASVCKGKTATVEHNDEIASGVQLANERKLEKESVDETQQKTEPQKRIGKKTVAAKEVKSPQKDDSEDDEATSDSDAEPQKQAGKKAVVAKEVKSPPKGESEDDEATSDLDAKPQKQTGKKAAAAKDVKLPPKDYSEDDEEESDSENKPLKLSAKKVSSKKKDDGRKCGSGKNATENDQAKAMSSDDEMDYSPKSAAKSAKGEGSSKEIPVNSAKRKRSAVKDKVSDTIKYDKSLVGQKVKVWWPEDKMYYEGVIESFDAAKKKHKVLYVDGEKETMNLKTEKWEILEEYSVRDEEQTIEAENEEASPETHKKKKSKTDVAPSPSQDKIKDSAKRVGGGSSSGKTKGTASKDSKSKDKSAAKSTSQKSSGKSSDAATSSKLKKDEETPKAGMEERVRQMGPSGVVDQLTGMANESAALFSHAAESIRALELDNSELKRQLNELVLRDKGYYEKISVLEGEIADLKSLHDQMKLTCEVRVVDADRRATEAERRFAEAKREMEVENFKLKQQLDEHVLCDQGYEEKIRILGKRLAEAKRKMVGAEGSMKAALASLAL